jgi:hypothetical protein
MNFSLPLRGGSGWGIFTSALLRARCFTTEDTENTEVAQRKGKKPWVYFGTVDAESEIQPL